MFSSRSDGVHGMTDLMVCVKFCMGSEYLMVCWGFVWMVSEMEFRILV